MRLHSGRAFQVFSRCRDLLGEILSNPVERILNVHLRKIILNWILKLAGFDTTSFKRCARSLLTRKQVGHDAKAIHYPAVTMETSLLRSVVGHQHRTEGLLSLQ